DRVMAAGHERDSQLRADAVGARHEHGLFQLITTELKETAERSDIRKHTGRERGPGQRRDAADGFVACVDIDARLPVVHQKSSFPITVCNSPRRGEPSGDSQNVRRVSAKKRSFSRSSSSMSNPSATSVSMASRLADFSSIDNISGVLRRATVAIASATGA